MTPGFPVLSSIQNVRNNRQPAIMLRTWPSGQIAIWLSKNCQKLDIFFKKKKNCQKLSFKKKDNFWHWKKKSSFWQFFLHSNGNFPEGQVSGMSDLGPNSRKLAANETNLVSFKMRFQLSQRVKCTEVWS